MEKEVSDKKLWFEVLGSITISINCIALPCPGRSVSPLKWEEEDTFYN